MLTKKVMLSFLLLVFCLVGYILIPKIILFLFNQKRFSGNVVFVIDANTPKEFHVYHSCPAGQLLKFNHGIAVVEVKENSIYISNNVSNMNLYAMNRMNILSGNFQELRNDSAVSIVQKHTVDKSLLCEEYETFLYKK